MVFVWGQEQVFQGGMKLKGMGSSPKEKDLGVLGGEELDMTQQRALAALKDAQGCIPSSVGTGLGRERILPFCPALLRPPQKSCIQARGSEHPDPAGGVLAHGRVLDWMASTGPVPPNLFYDSVL